MDADIITKVLYILRQCTPNSQSLIIVIQFTEYNNISFAVFKTYAM